MKSYTDKQIAKMVAKLVKRWFPDGITRAEALERFQQFRHTILGIVDRCPISTADKTKLRRML